MAYGTIEFYTPDGKRRVVHVNGGSVTIRDGEQKPYEAVKVNEEYRMEFLNKLQDLLEKL
jgi:hypothetical protein